MTTEERLRRLEEGFVTLVELNQNVVKVLEVQQVQIAEHRAEVAEYRRETAQYQRLWVHLARKHGWQEDEDWPPPAE